MEIKAHCMMMAMYYADKLVSFHLSQLHILMKMHDDGYAVSSIMINKLVSFHLCQLQRVMSIYFWGV